MRLRQAILAGKDTTSTTTLLELYKTSRGQIAVMLDGDLLKEFDSLFPANWDRGTVSTGSVTVTASGVRGRLSAMAGWLDGLIEGLRFEAQITANAEAYAREALKAERGMGFRRKQ